MNNETVKVIKVKGDYDKKKYPTHVCPKCGCVLNRIRGEVESIRLYETCPDCKVKLDWSGVFGRTYDTKNRERILSNNRWN